MTHFNFLRYFYKYLSVNDKPLSINFGELFGRFN